jgi:RNA polymerase sigma-70 factor (ECF subfamily)
MSTRDEIGRQAPALTADLLAFARTLTHDAALADDLVQETFVRALAGAEGFRGDAGLRTWMHRILYHAAVDQIRRSRREVLDDDPAGDGERVDAMWADDAYTVDPSAVYESAADRRDVEDALVRLPFHYRSAVVLHDMVGWTSAEIAEEMGIGLPAAKQRLRRGRMMLTSALAAGAERRRALEGVPMRCWDARSLVSDYIDSQLSADQRSAVEAHLADCPTCPPLYAALVGTLEGVSALRDIDAVVPPALAERVAAVVTARG